MQKQATWYGPDFFPDAKAGDGTVRSTSIGEDIGLFYFPPIDPAYGNPALGAGDALMVIQDRPEVRAAGPVSVATPEGIQAWIELGSAISANQATPAEWYEGNYKLEVASEIVANASQFGFDASDLMPASGAGLLVRRDRLGRRERREHRAGACRPSTLTGQSVASSLT